MKTVSCSVLLAGCAIASAIVSSASAITIDFESIPAGSVASNFLAPYGISSVTSSGGTSPAVYDYGSEPDIKAPSGTKVFLPSGGVFPSPTGFFDTTLTFTTAVPYFQFSKIAEVNAPYTYGIAGWRARAFDSGSNIVAEVQKNLNGGLDFPSPLPNQTFLLQGASLIKTVVFTVNYNFQSTSGTVGIDDFTFVPEPASLTLLCTAVCAALGLRRR
jgi:hypothetical protein